MYIDIPGFYAAFFGNVADLETASKVVFKKCREGNNPLYCEENEWDRWPKDILSWIAQMSEQFEKFAKDHNRARQIKEGRWLSGNGKEDNDDNNSDLPTVEEVLRTRYKRRAFR